MIKHGPILARSAEGLLALHQCGQDVQRDDADPSRSDCNPHGARRALRIGRGCGSLRDAASLSQRAAHLARPLRIDGNGQAVHRVRRGSVHVCRGVWRSVKDRILAGARIRNRQGRSGCDIDAQLSRVDLGVHCNHIDWGSCRCDELSVAARRDGIRIARLGGQGAVRRSRTLRSARSVFE